MHHLRLTLTFCVFAAVLAPGFSRWSLAAEADDSAVAVEDAESGRLLKWTTLEQAFLRANRNRAVLSQYVERLAEQLRETEGEEAKAEIRKQLGDARVRLHRLNTAMEVMFSSPAQRAYEYNPVQSTVYLRVGTVREVFERAVRTREVLKQYIQQQHADLQDETDEQDRLDIEERLQEATRQYQTVAAALQIIFGVTPQRNYTYDPANATLYLNVTEDELEDLRQQISRMQEERDQ